jgi:beta-lactamase superfamily II metal-dependent hydrolase
MAVRFVKSLKADFEPDKPPGQLTEAQKEKFQTYELIWGEQVDRAGPAGKDAKGRDTARVTAWGLEGTMLEDDLGEEPLLQVYIIDVGQGDGILVNTPDGKWHLIDAGTTSAKQQLNKGAPNFLGWKFRNGLGSDTVTLENVMFSHSDLDHFGGLIDVLKRNFGRVDAQHPQLDLDVKNFRHPGVAKYARDKDKLGHSEAGTSAPLPHQDQGVKREGKFITELLEDTDSFKDGTEFAAEFADLAGEVGKLPSVSRLSRRDKFLPGYGQGEPVEIHVLGPVLEDFEPKDKPGETHQGLRVLESDSVTVNGHSIVLRLDYKKARILLTGDLNDASHRLLLSHHDPGEFAVDVGKGCHHGAEHILPAFIRAMGARATVISSGDNEGFSHPRPFAMGLVTFYGRTSIDAKNGGPLPPLLYATELARSTKLEGAKSVGVPDDSDPTVTRTVPADKATVKAGSADRPLGKTPLATGLIYGLVNVRTDGEKILCAVHNEQKKSFDVVIFKAGESAPDGQP